MQKIICCLTVAIFLLLVGCKDEKPTPKVIYENKPKTTKTEKIDTTAIKVIDLPILIDGTSFLIHPIGDVRVYDSYRSTYGSSKVNQVSYAISNFNSYELTGYLDNLKFQHIDSTSVYALTDKNMQIQTVTYLHDIAKKTGKKILVYSLADSDTNRDGKINQNDIKSLYLSTEDGLHFTKVSEDYNEVIDWNIIEKLNRLYFRCIEDINRNGAFDKNDKVHYHYINLLSDKWEAQEYQPL